MQHFAGFLGLNWREANLAVIGLGLGAVGVFFAYMNWACFLSSIRLKKQKIDKYYSMVLTFGVFLAFGCSLIAPLHSHARWIWLLDPSSLMLIIYSPFLLKQLIPIKQKTKR